MSQYFSLSAKGELRKENFCAEVHNKKTVQLTECHGHKRNQYWTYFPNGTIYHPSSKKCLTTFEVEPGKGLLVEKCKRSKYQKWKLTFLNETVFSKNKIIADNLDFDY